MPRRPLAARFAPCCLLLLPVSLPAAGATAPRVAAAAQGAGSAPGVAATPLAAPALADAEPPVAAPPASADAPAVQAGTAGRPSHADATALAERLGLGPVTDALQRGTHWYLALAGGGVAVVERGARGEQLLSRLAEGRRIVRRGWVAGGLVAVEQREEPHLFSLEAPAAPRPTTWAELLRGGAGAPDLPVAASPPAGAPSPDATPARPASATPVTPTVRLTQVEGAALTFDGGRDAGLRAGTQLRLAGEGGEGVEDRVVEVERVTATHAFARLGRGESARVGEEAQVTDAPVTARLLFPQGAPARLRFGFHARPFLALEARTATGQSTRAGGLMVDLHAAWRPAELPLTLEARLEPLSVGMGTGERHYPGSAALVAAYTTDFLEVGLGPGALFGAEGPCYQDLAPGAAQREICEENTAATVHQTLRLGALDGLHLAWRSSVASQENRFLFGSGRGELQLPLTSRLALFGAGGGARSGWAFGELGVRNLLEGTGGPGSLLLTASLGYVGLSDGRSGNDLSGPAVAVGLEWRR